MSSVVIHGNKTVRILLLDMVHDVFTYVNQWPGDNHRLNFNPFFILYPF